MAELQDFKCPSCGGAIHFDTGVQKMKCPYCDAEFDIDSLKALENEPEILDEDKFAWDNTPGQEWSGRGPGASLILMFVIHAVVK